MMVGVNKTTHFVTERSEVDVKYDRRDVAILQDEAAKDDTLTPHEMRMFKLSAITAQSCLRAERLLTSVVREIDTLPFGE